MVKNPPANAGDSGSIPGSGRSPGGGHGNPLQCSCLENPMERGAWWATVQGVTQSQTGLSDGHTNRGCHSKDALSFQHRTPDGKTDVHTAGLQAQNPPVRVVRHAKLFTEQPSAPKIVISEEGASGKQE